ncbi:hypothetical protein FRB93_000888 [Tulasnella sp. JGI-2019a]|nr:hypothetical protein FRB93_000888 [Tulasnella sp. JGI-2019a]
MFTSLLLATLTVVVHLSILSVHGLVANGLNQIPDIGQYQASQYRPICGTLAAGIYTSQFGDYTICNAAMTDFHSIPDTYALYDSYTGIRYPDTEAISDTLVDPSGPCMCYSLASSTGIMADICTVIDYMGGGQNLATVLEMGVKALPQCDSGDIASATLSSVPSATPAGPTAPPTGTATGSANVTIQSTPTSTSSASDTSSKSSSKIGPYGSLVWAPIISALGAMAGLYYAFDIWRIKRRKALESDSRTEMAHLSQPSPHNPPPRPQSFFPHTPFPHTPYYGQR